MGVCNCSLFCCTLLYAHSSIAIILMGKRELIALLNLSSWCLVMVEQLFLAVLRGCLQFVIVVFPTHTHLLFLLIVQNTNQLKTSLCSGLCGQFYVFLFEMLCKLVYKYSVDRHPSNPCPCYSLRYIIAALICICAPLR